MNIKNWAQKIINWVLVRVKTTMIPTALLSVAAVTCILVVQPYGCLRTTYDSQDLFAAGSDIATYLTGKNPQGHSYLVRAPFHPLYLSLFSNKMIALWWLNSVTLLLSGVLIFFIAVKSGLSRIDSALFVLVNVSFYPWLMNFTFAWTEPVFIVLILSLTYGLQRQAGIFYTAILNTALFLVRKAGIFFFPATATYYLLGRQYKKASIIFGLGIFEFIGWQLLELSFDSSGTFADMLGTLDEYKRIFYVEAVTTWMLPMMIPLVIRVIAILLTVALTIYISRDQILGIFDKQQNLVLLSLAGVYACVLVVFSGASGYEDAERYLNVVFTHWLLMAFLFVKRLNEILSFYGRIVVAFIVCGWLVYTISRTVHHLF